MQLLFCSINYSTIINQQLTYTVISFPTILLYEFQQHFNNTFLLFHHTRFNSRIQQNFILILSTLLFTFHIISCFTRTLTVYLLYFNHAQHHHAQFYYLLFNCRINLSIKRSFRLIIDQPVFSQALLVLNTYC